MAQIDIKDENLLKLMEIKRIIQTEDDVESTLDESLARVLDFYKKFVPYN